MEICEECGGLKTHDGDYAYYCPNCTYRRKSDMGQLISAITEQTKAINALVESNQRLMSILLEGAADEPEESMLTYLDGSPK